MLTELDIQNNKKRFLELVQSITRDGVDKDRLLNQLENSDFFEAPASAMYHNAFRGGLCAHSLNVYDILHNLNLSFFGEDSPYSEDTIIIVSLFHDFDKMNKYEKTVKNKKVYSATGSKYDELGKFDWVSIPGYAKKEAKDVFMVGTHGENSVYMTETFIPLSTEEHAAILNHHSKYDNPMLDTTNLYNKYSLACMLHMADMGATYIKERV